MNRNKAIDRARKLMAMAADASSPNEAAIAARRARKIIDAYQLNVSDLEQSEFGTQTYGKARKRVPVWENVIVASVALLNDCIGEISTSGGIIFKGMVEDVEVSVFMSSYLIENGKRQCKTFMKSDRFANMGLFKKGYAYAISVKIREIIKERKAYSTGTGKSLVVVKKELVEERFGNQETKNYTFKGKGSTSFYSGYQAGQATNIVSGVKFNQHAKVE